jgi:hypothetical protein
MLRGLTNSGNPPDTDNYVAETDANGHFLVQGMVPGKYEATASRKGYLSRVPGAVARIAVDEGQRAAVTLKLLPAGIIAGRIVNMNGEPVAGAKIEAMQEAYDSNDSLARRQLESRGGATSDDRGEYRIFDLAPGRYYLRVAENNGNQNIFETLPRKLVQTFARTDYPAALDVTAGGELPNVEIRLRVDAPHNVRGIVPAPHTNDFSIAMQRRGEASGPPPYNMYSTNDEEFTFGGVMPGSYLVFTTIHNPAHPEQALFARQLVEVVDRDLEGVVLPLTPMKTVTGKVTADGPLAFRFSNMNVELDPDNPDSPTVTTRVSEDGTFAIDVLPESYVLTRPRIATAYVKAVRVGDREAPDFRLDFAHMDGPLDILFGTDGGKVSGVVKNAEGDPAGAVRVTLIPAGAQKARNLRFTNTDEDGRFELPAVAPGEYQIFAWLDAGLGAPLDPGFRKKYEEQGLAVRIAPNGNQLVELRGIVARR